MALIAEVTLIVGAVVVPEPLPVVVLLQATELAPAGPAACIDSDAV